MTSINIKDSGYHIINCDKKSIQLGDKEKTQLSLIDMNQQQNNDYKQVHNSIHTSSHSSDLLWMLVDGIGLAIVAGATVMEGTHLWFEFFHSYWESNNVSILFWFTGRSCQVLGITILIAYAASFQLFPIIELIGMVFITIGPLFNMFACYLFITKSDPFYLFNKQWRSSECVELLGMLILDISLIHMEEIYVLIAEVLGFFILCCAAIIQFDYHTIHSYPYISLKWDLVHISECIGLILLTIVAFAQYHTKLQKHLKESKKKHNIIHDNLLIKSNQSKTNLVINTIYPLNDSSKTICNVNNQLHIV